MKKLYITILPLLIAAACSNSATSEVPESSISVETDYEDRTYELGESAIVTLSVTERHASGNYFDLFLNCDGAISGTIDEEPLVLGECRSVFYEIGNASASSKVLHITLTPQAGQSAEQNMKFSALITAADGTTAEVCIPLRSVNSAKITAAAICTSLHPIEAGKQLDIVLLTHKENYHGAFEATAKITQGHGFFIIDGQDIQAGDTFSLPANEEFSFQYQPLCSGQHEIHFLITDHISTDISVLNIQIQDQS